MARALLLTFAMILSGCSETDDLTSNIPNVSDKPDIQGAYEKCVADTRKTLREDNPETPGDIMKHLDKGALQTCHSAVVITCNNNRQSTACQLMLDMY